MNCTWSVEAYRRSDELCEWAVDLDADRATLEQALAIELPTPDVYALTPVQAELALRFAPETPHLDEHRLEFFLAAVARERPPRSTR